MMNGVPAVMLVLSSSAADKLRGSWQSRLVAGTKGKMRALVLAILAHSYFNAMDTLLHVTLPGHRVAPPCYSGPGKIMHLGQVVCDMVLPDGSLERNSLVFGSKEKMIAEFRRLADRIKLSDRERADMFDAIGRWIVVDYRIKPSVEHVA